MASHDSRTPRLDREIQGTDVRNNIIYNWGQTNSAYGAESVTCLLYTSCEKINNGKRNINIEMFYKNGMLSCTITNSVNDKEFSMTSRKGDMKNHGIGLNSIRSAVEKYSGILNTEYSKGFFTLRDVYKRQKNNQSVLPDLRS